MLDLSFISKIKNKLFPFYRDKELKFVFAKLNENNLNKQTSNAMFVGGCVRKYLCNQEIDDIDIATSLPINQVKEKFDNSKFKVIDTGIKHGTITLITKKLKLEITSLRKDIKTDGRHAEIEFTDNWVEDSSRRDFTVNAIYLNIKGEIFDPQLGLSDLKKNKIKFIGDPNKRIQEDYLRIIRFIRFSLEYSSEVDKTNIEAIKLNLDGIKIISKERIILELIKILKLKNFLNILNQSSLKEIFSLIFPEIRYLNRLSRLNIVLKNFDFSTKNLLAILLIDEKDNHDYFSHKYNISNNLRLDINLKAKNFKDLQNNSKFFKKDLKKNIFYHGKEHILFLNLMNFVINKNFKYSEFKKIQKNINKCKIPKFPFNGDFLKNKGI